VVTLSAVADIVNQDCGLKIHVLQLAHDAATHDADELSLDQCIVEIGIGGSANHSGKAGFA
jgi:hypothetical protein